MSKIKDEAETRCELALMGKVVEVRSNDELDFMTRYILNATGHENDFQDLDIVKDRICRYCEKNEVKYLVCNTIMGSMKCITYLVDTNEEEEPKPFETDYGTGYPCAFSYVFNMDADDCSEFGDCFFHKMSDGFYHRKG